VKYIFIIFFSFCGLFFNNGLKAAEKINIKFEEMEIPLTIEQLSKLEKYKDDSTELIDWVKKNILNIKNLLNFIYIFAPAAILTSLTTPFSVTFFAISIPISFV